MQVPDPAVVYRWRLQAEQQSRARGNAGMTDEQVYILLNNDPHCLFTYIVNFVGARFCESIHASIRSVFAETLCARTTSVPPFALDRASIESSNQRQSISNECSLF